MSKEFFISEEMKRLRKKILTVVCVMLFMLLFGTVAYMLLEKWSFVDSLYFSTVTLTTIGYGDLYPTTPASRFFTVIFIIVGVAVMLNALTFLGSYYYRYFENTQDEINSNIHGMINKINRPSEDKWVTLKASKRHELPEDIIFDNKRRKI